MRYFYLTSWVPAVQRLEIKPVDVGKKALPLLLRDAPSALRLCRTSLSFRVPFFCVATQLFQRFPLKHIKIHKSLWFVGANFWKKNTAKRLSKKKSAEPLTESNPWKHTVDINQKSSDHQWRSW